MHTNDEGTIENKVNIPLKSFGGCDFRTISYSPVNLETEEVIKKLQQSCWAGISLKPYLNETFLRKELRDYNEIGIVFPDGLAPLRGNMRGTITNAVISYKILMHASTLPSTKKVLPLQKLGDEDFIANGKNRTIHLIKIGFKKKFLIFYTHFIADNGKSYLETEFLKIQLAIDEILAEMITGQKLPYNVKKNNKNSLNF